ncbi:MAG: InlB B-repeat-containing protein [Ruminococcus sp.]|nr:InlB B-repeat-containing protein [Ruminococcus sp.]
MKKQFKKSLSLFMAVLMLMSCWVFFAPEKAEAVTSTNYSLRMDIWVEKGANSDTTAQIAYGYVTNNGKGTYVNKSSWIDIKGDMGTADKKMKHTEITGIPGFPVYVRLQVKNARQILGMGDKIALHVKGISVSGVDVIGSKDWAEAPNIEGNRPNSTDKWNGKAEPSGNNTWDFTWKATGFSTTIKSGSEANIGGWTYPKANAVVFDQNPSDVTLNTSGNTTTTFQTHLNDQYGVRVSSDASTYSKTASISASNRSYTTGCSAAYGTAKNDGYDSGTVTMTQSARILNTYDTNTLTLKASYTFNGVTKEGTKTFTVTDPQYAFTLDPNGGRIKHSNDWFDASNVGNSKYTKYYGNTLTSTQIPSVPSGGDREGYELIGMYPDKAKDDNFDLTKPVAGSGSYTGQLTTSTQIESNKTWYAAWWAKNVDVEFRTEDNQIVATYKNGSKYDQTDTHGAAALEILKNMGLETVKSGSFNGNFSRWVVKEAYDFSGNDRNLAGTPIDQATLKGKTVFVPEYTYGKNNYTVKFLGQTGKILSEQKYLYKAEPTLPNAESKATDAQFEYKWLGWAVRPTEDTTKYVYFVDSNGFDSNGEAIATVKDFRVRNDVTYVQVFEKKYREYTVTYKEKRGKTTTFTGLHYDDPVTAPEAETNFILNDRRWKFERWEFVAQGDDKSLLNGKCRGNATYEAVYRDEDIKFQIRFFDHTSDETGRPLNSITEYAKGATVTQPTNILRVYRDDFNEYRFIDWETPFNPVAEDDVDYYAYYQAYPLYTVNYYNGDELIEGATLREPAGTNITKAYVGETPTKEDDKYATNYVFKGWADADDKTYTTLGEGDLDLYAQFDCDVTKYTVEFKDDDGSTISSKEYKYLEEIDVPENPTKAEDNTYTYEFRSWDSEVNPLCEDSITYTATYKRTYKYYTVEWLNEKGEVANTQKYIYNERINPPIAPATEKVSTDPNYTYVFDAWVNVADTTDKFVRGDRITGDAQYKATYKLEANICKVELYAEDGKTSLGKVEVPYGTDAAGFLNVASAPNKNTTADEHYNFSGWVTLDGAPLNTVTGDMKVKATYTGAEHTFMLDSYKVAPTFFESGIANWACSACGFEKTEAVAPLNDHVAPTAKLYVRNMTWETPDDDHDYSEAKPVAPSNMFIINTIDSAERDKLNPLGTGSGVDTISYSIQQNNVDPSSISDWNTWYSYDNLLEERKGKEANVTAKLEDVIADFENTKIGNGDEFIIYGKIVDRLGNETYINSDLLIYDTEAPEVSVTSDCQNGSKHCIEATVKVKMTNDISSVKLNGEEIKLSRLGEITIDKAGLYQVAVTDFAGNTTRETFEIIGDHTKSDPIRTAATCEAAGSVKVVCTLCNEELENKTIHALDHDYKVVVIEPTCDEAGKTTKVCRRCGKTVDVEGSEVPALGHNLVENKLLRKDGTCQEKGKSVWECTRCTYSEVKEDEKIDPNAHVFYREKQTKDPTCTEKGEITHQCKYCGEVIKVKDVDALGHDDGKWTVKVAPTCTKEGTEELLCTRDNFLLDTREVAALGHSWKLTKEVDPTEEAAGYKEYTCSVCGETKTEEGSGPLVKHTFTFVDEDGKEIVKLVKLQGETITIADVPAQSKPATDTYKYTFEGWVDENGKAVQFPITSSDKDMTISPKFTADYVSYTVTFYKEDGITQYNNKVGYLHNDKTPAYVLPTTGPDKESDSKFDYKFAGWSTDGTKKNVVTEVKKFTSNMSFIAVYDAIPRVYNVVFAYDKENVIKTYKVPAGTDATNLFVAETDAEKPTKAKDELKHYTFDGWVTYNSAKLDNIQQDTLVFATFKGEDHVYKNYKPDKVQTVVCTTEGTKIGTCECGATNEIVTDPMLPHNWGTPDANGVIKCQNEGCTATMHDERTFTVTFYDENGITVIKTIDYIKYGEDISTRIPTPTKAATNEFTYDFAGWTDKDGKKVDVVNNVTANAEYYATYTKTARRYTVIFAYDSKNVITTYPDQPYMADFTKIYNLPAPEKKETDDYGHYEFAGWSNRGLNEEHKSIYFEAIFRKVDHTYTTAETGATCTNGAGTTYTCTTCGYNYTKATGAALGHIWTISNRVEPTYNKEGYIESICTRCGETKREKLPIIPTIIAEIFVKDRDNHGIEGVKVTLVDIKSGEFIASATTGSDGIAKLRIPSATTYTIILQGNDMQDYIGSITIQPDGKPSLDWDGVRIEVSRCTCTCHRDGAWANIFRFFHKIIKLFAGKYKCCNNPDPRYG